MAIVVVLVGQCGNQFGDELFTQLSLCTGLAAASPSTAASSPPPPAAAATPKARRPHAVSTGAESPFFTRDGMARCVLVDTEPKVVLGVRQRHAAIMRAENVVHGQSGRGNNWGLGYHGVKTALSKRNEDNAAVQRAFRNMARDQREEDDNVLGRALQAIYRETRRTSDADDGTDGFEAIILVHSLVGGTGSGLASRLTERLRLYFTEPPAGQRVDDVYEATMMRIDGFDGGLYGPARRARHLVNVAVAPQVVGEVATQGLNAALTLQVLQKYSDAVLLLRNDDAMAPGEAKGSSVCAGTSVLSRCVTFKEANEVLVALLLPVLRYGLAPGCVTQLLMQCIPPAYGETTGGNKILTLLPTPQRSYATMRQSVHRAYFFSINGGRAFMPGYAPTVPIDEMLSRTAQLLWSRQQQVQRQQRRSSATTTAGSRGAKAKVKPPLPALQQQQQRRAPPSPSPSIAAAATQAGRRTSFRSGGEDDRNGSYTVQPLQPRLSGKQPVARGQGFRSGDDTGAARAALGSAEGPFSSASPSSRRRPPPVTPFSSPPEKARPRVQQSYGSASRIVDGPDRSSRGGAGRREVDLSFDREERDERGGYGSRSSGEAQRFSHECCSDDNNDDNDGGNVVAGESNDELNYRVFHTCSTTIPPALFRHYQELRRAPVTKMFETIDGLLLMNQALELDRRVLFPLLRSAALKVSSGAFMSSYEDVGVTSERVKRAVREVAETMANSEEL